MEDILTFNSIVKTLPAFSAAAKAESFVKASKILGIPQKSVSRYILHLEQYLGINLFMRERGKLQLTLEGSELYHATSSSFAHIMTVLNEISLSKDKTRFVIGCPQLLLSWLSRRLTCLKQLAPHFEIELVEFEYRNQNYQFEMDIIFAFGLGKWQGFESYLLFEEEVFPVCSPAFAAKFALSNNTISVEELTKLPLIHGNWALGLTWQSWFASLGVEYSPNGVNKEDLYSYLISQELAIRGDGIALAWAGVFQSNLNSGVLEEIPNLRTKSNIGYYMLLNPESPKNDIARKWWRMIS